MIQITKHPIPKFNSTNIMKKQFISWRRVSTFKQNKSGLGLEAQKEIIRYFVERDNGELVADYSECYTGKELSGCKELRKAMQHAKNIGAVLVIAKSDRFRNCQEALGILDEMGEGNIEFCDLPHSDRFTLTLFWALAEREALITSIRTKQALAAKKARGEKLGGAASKWQETRNAKTYKERQEEADKSGSTQNSRHIQGRDFAIWVKVFQKAFPDTCSKDVFTWDTHTWKSITTRGNNKFKIIEVMKDIQDLDQTGEMFKTWDFNAPTNTLQMRIGGAIAALHNSVKRAQRYGNETTTNK